MSIFDKILGRDEKEDKKEEQPRKKAVGEMKVPVAKAEEQPSKAEKKPVEKKAKAVKAEKPKKEVVKRKVSKKDDNIAYKVLFENLISEKTTLLVAENKYVFKVNPKAGKFQIKEAIEGYYGVQVTSVNTIKIRPKKRIHGRTIGWTKGFKKAVVTLRQGDSIGAVEGV